MDADRTTESKLMVVLLSKLVEMWLNYREANPNGHKKNMGQAKNTTTQNKSVEKIWALKENRTKR